LVHTPGDYRLMSDEALLEVLHATDDHDAYACLFRRHYSGLCAYVNVMVRCRQASDEIVSDVLLKLWNARRELRIQSSLKAYLTICARNNAIDYLRRVQRRRTVGAEAIDPERPSRHDSPFDALVHEETNALIEAAINGLPPQGRTIFRLSRDQGMKYREIAEHLGLSIKTIETHMTRSLVYLRERVGATEHA
jgi:RNA polymerase sigma-70 factor (ECF subfamily)